MNNARIQAILLANGFKLKDQGEGRLDLNPYVYDGARALLDGFLAEQAASGMAIAPIVPTPPMVEAAFAGKMESQDCLGQARRREAMAADFSAMISAAPSVALSIDPLRSAPIGSMPSDDLNAAWNAENGLSNWGHEPTAKGLFEDGWNARDAQIARLYNALRLAKTHIGWCWDQIEANTRLHRDGSAVVHEQIAITLAHRGANPYAR